MNLTELFKNRALIGPAVAVAGAEFKTPDDGFFHVVPKGEFPHTEAGVVQVLDDAALTAIFNDLKTRQGNVLIDNEHFSYDVTKDSAAMGWAADDYQLRSNGIWAKPRWTAPGAEALKNGVKRFISPVFLPSDVQVLDGNRVRPLRLDTWGLTNAPNMRGMVPLSNRHPANAGSAEAKTNNPTKGQSMKSVAESLGLSADASEQAVLAEVTKLQNRVKTAEESVTPLKNRVATLEGENKTLLEAQADTDLAPLKDKLSVEEVTTLRGQLLANRTATLPVVKLIADKILKVPTAMFNRAGAKTPDGKPNAAADRTAQQAAAVRQHQLKNRCTFDAAWSAVRAEKPELFTEETK